MASQFFEDSLNWDITHHPDRQLALDACLIELSGCACDLHAAPRMSAERKRRMGRTLSAVIERLVQCFEEDRAHYRETLSQVISDLANPSESPATAERPQSRRPPTAPPSSSGE